MKHTPIYWAGWSTANMIFLFINFHYGIGGGAGTSSPIITSIGAGCAIAAQILIIARAIEAS